MHHRFFRSGVAALGAVFALAGAAHAGGETPAAAAPETPAAGAAAAPAVPAPDARKRLRSTLPP